jgi:alpha-ribazole phosphatase
VSSPFRRAREAAEKLAGERGLSVESDPDWREIDLGDWDGIGLAELRADPRAADLMAHFYRDPTAAQPSLSRRVGAALARLAEQAKPVLVVTHAGPIRTAVSVACGLPIASLWAVRIEPGTRVRLDLGRHPDRGLWGEIIEIVPP